MASVIFTSCEEAFFTYCTDLESLPEVCVVVNVYVEDEYVIAAVRAATGPAVDVIEVGLPEV